VSGITSRRRFDVSPARPRAIALYFRIAMKSPHQDDVRSRMTSECLDGTLDGDLGIGRVFHSSFRFYPATTQLQPYCCGLCDLAPFLSPARLRFEPDMHPARPVAYGVMSGKARSEHF
jgi:hypothetical protein